MTEHYIISRPKRRNTKMQKIGKSFRLHSEIDSCLSHLKINCSKIMNKNLYETDIVSALIKYAAELDDKKLKKILIESGWIK